MDDKIKLIIIIALAAVLLFSFFLDLKIYGAKKIVEQELALTRSESESLSKKFQESRKENKQLQEKIDTLTGDLNKISQQKDESDKRTQELQKKYDSLLEEKEKLEQKLKGQPAVITAQAPSTENSYWSELVKEKASLDLQLKALKTSNEQLKSEKDALEVNLSNLMREKQDLQEQFQYHQKMLDTMASEFIWEKNTRFQMQEKLAPIKNENALLRRQLSTVSNSKAKLEKKLEGLISEKDVLERRLIEVEVFLKDKLFDIGDARQRAGQPFGQTSPEEGAQNKKESVELPEIVVRSQPEAYPKDTGGSFLFGNIISINEDNNFVVIDLGEDSGIRPGQKLQVYRAEEVIAEVEVVQVRKNIAACDIKTQSVTIHVGDKVK